MVTKHIKMKEIKRTTAIEQYLVSI